MNIIFFGSDIFAVPSLEALLLSAHQVVCVVTQPDRKKGRGLHLEGTPVKARALKSKLEIFQPQDINSASAVKTLNKYSADLFVVLAYGQILSEEVLLLPKLFALNIHASLLPKYRGAAPINRAIINSEKQSGVTVMKIIQKMDAGPIIMQERVKIDDNDTAASLGERLSILGSQLLMKSVQDIAAGQCKFLPQDEEKVIFAPKLKKHDGLINWSQPAQKIHCLIRGCYDWPGAFTYYKGKLLKIYRASVFLAMEQEGVKISAGEIVKVCKDEIIVSTGSGDLVIEDLQLEGKRRMRPSDFIAGHKICVGEKLG